jgi:MFS family permease
MTTIAAVKPMVSYRALEFGAGPLEIGLIVSSFALLSALAAVPVGRAVDRSGAKPFIVGGTVLVLASLAVALSSTTVLVLALSQMLLGLGQIVSTVGGQTLIANQGDRAGIRSRFANYSVTMSLGQLVGPAAAGLLAVAGATTALGPTGTVFAAGCVTVGAAVVLSVAGIPGPRLGNAQRDEASPPAGPASAREVIRMPHMKTALFASAMVLVTVDLLMAYFPIYGVQHGLSVATVGFLLSLRAFASIVSRLSMGRLVRATTQSTVLAGSMFLAASGMLMLAWASEFWVLCGLMIALGFGLGIGQPLTMAWVADSATEQARGVALAVRLTGNRLAQLLIPSFMGGVAAVGGITGLFVTLSLVLTTGAVFVRLDARASPEPTNASDSEALVAK